MSEVQRITPFLWFDGQAEEAVNFYVSVFRDSRIDTVTRYGLSWQIVPTGLGSLLKGVKR